MVFDLQGFTGFFFVACFVFLKRLLSFLFSIEGWSYASEIQVKMHESSDPDSMHFSPIPFLFERPLPQCFSRVRASVPMKPFYLSEIECSQAGRPYYHCATVQEIACLCHLIAYIS